MLTIDSSDDEIEAGIVAARALMSALIDARAMLDAYVLGNTSARARAVLWDATKAIKHARDVGITPRELDSNYGG